MAESQSTRALALARRKALSSAGKGAATGSSPERTRANTESVAASKSGAMPEAAPAKPRARAVAPSTQAGNSSRAVALARRKALSSQGKRADTSTDRTTRGGPKVRKAAAMMASAPAANKDGDCGCGCEGRGSADNTVTSTPKPSQRPAKARVSQHRSTVQTNPTRAAALARRQAQSTRGKAGIGANGLTAAQTARAANPQLSGRELAQALRSQRSKRGNAGQKKSEPTGRVRPTKPSTSAAAEDQPWKVGASETVRGQTVTGTMVGRSQKTTGDEPSTCRNVTGTEYMGADIFRDFCQTEPGKGPAKVRQTPTSHGNRVTGNEVGRSTKVTGDEPGTCKNVTGTEYVSANQAQAFCGTDTKPGPAKATMAETRKGKAVTGDNVGRSAKVTGDEPGADRELTGTQYTKSGDGQAPAKVGSSNTLRGGSVTGSMVGRSDKVTGDEPGSCRNITGDDYVGQEQYQGFCSSTPAPQDRKVGASQTLKGETVTGTQTGRGSMVTGDEPGTCKAITGTPYAGAEQYRSYCQPEEAIIAEARTRPQRSTPGTVMTGRQPGIGGKMTGAESGACEPLTGTPYVGADQFAEACPATAAEPGSPDFPQALGQAAPWADFSVAAPSHASQTAADHADVTGSRYEQGQITGPFGKASGKVTGTEEARFGRGNGAPAPAPMPETAVETAGRVKPRISGEGQNAGLKITGDDWDRGDRVTGTEGTSATRRNPTRRGPMSAMTAMQIKRNEDVAAPLSKVTGSSGNTEKGSLITYSGGARG